MSALHRQITAHSRFVGEAARERGAANEARLLEAVLALRAGGASWILDARRATPEEDAAGADVVVTTDAGTLYLQSKSSRAGLAKFSAKARTIRVEAVVVSLDDATTRSRALVALSALRAEAMRPVPRPVVLEVRKAPRPLAMATRVEPVRAPAEELVAEPAIPPRPAAPRPTKSERRLAHEAAVALAKKRKAERKRRHEEEVRAARARRKASWSSRREPPHNERHPNDRHPPPPPPLPIEEQVARAKMNRLQRTALAESLGRGCPLCGAPVEAPTPWRRAEDGAHVCEACCEGLEAFVVDPAEVAA